MKVALLGGGGFISTAVERRLAAAGHETAVLSRRGRCAHPASRAIRGDRRDTEALAALAALAAGGWDGVVDFLCYTAADAGLALEAFRGRAGRLVMISTGSVYWCTGAWRNPVGEDQYERRELSCLPATALTPGSIEYDYGAGKRAAEDLLESAAGDLPSVRLRFPVVGGPGDPTGRYAGYIRRLAGGGPLVLPDGGFNAFRHLYVEDAAAAVLAALERPGLAGGYNVTGEEILSLRDLARLLAAALGRDEPEVAGPPRAWLEERGFAGLFAPFSAIRDQVMDNGRAVRELGLAPTPWAGWLAATVAADLAPDPGGVRPRADELAAAGLWQRTLSGVGTYQDAGKVR